MAASLAAVSALSLLTWQAGGVASLHATFNMPFVSSQPCVVMITLLPLLRCLVVFRRRARAGRISARRG
jgi:hypothetical protein